MDIIEPIFTVKVSKYFTIYGLYKIIYIKAIESNVNSRLINKLLCTNNFCFNLYNELQKMTYNDSIVLNIKIDSELMYDIIK